MQLLLHNEKFCIPLRCPTVLVHPKAQEKKSTAKGEEQQRGSSREEEQQRIRAAERKRSRGEAQQRGSAVAARDSKEKRVF